MERTKLIRKLDKRNQKRIITEKLLAKKIRTSKLPIRLHPLIKIDNRFCIPTEMKMCSIALKQHDYYQFITSRPEFFRKIFPPLKLLS
jgi:hypothetical protein